MDVEQRASLVFDFVDRLLEDVEEGEVRPLHEYLPRYPGCEEEVSREYFALLKVPDREPDSKELRVGPYRLLRQLGRGGQGVVWLAEDSRLARQVALKMLTAPLGTIPERQRERLRREAEVVSRLEHPDVCGVYEADLSGEVPYVAMRFIPGDTLAKVLARHADGQTASADNASSDGPHPDVACRPSSLRDIDRLTVVFERLARALHAAHEAGVVHRDVKPGNIMITPEGAPVLLDFGLARHLSDHESREQTALTAAGEVFGTLAYMAPEQHGADPERALDRRVDIYALGVTLYETLTLQCPYRAETSRGLLEAVLRGEALSPRRLHPDIPRDLEAICLTAMAPERDRRYATAADLADDLRAVREGRPVAARPRSATTMLMRRASRHPWTTIAAGALVFASVAAAALGSGWRGEAAERKSQHGEHVTAHAAFLRLRDAHREERAPDPLDEAVVQRFIPADATLERQLILGSPLSRDSAELFVRYAADATRGAKRGPDARYPRGTVAEPDPRFRLVGEASGTARPLRVRLERPGHPTPPRELDILWPAGATELAWHMPGALPLDPGHWRWSVRNADGSEDVAPIASAVFEVVDPARPAALLAGLETTGDVDLDREVRCLTLLRAGLGREALDELGHALSDPFTGNQRARHLLLSAWAAGLMGDSETVDLLRAEWLDLHRSNSP